MDAMLISVDNARNRHLIYVLRRSRLFDNTAIQLQVESWLSDISENIMVHNRAGRGNISSTCYVCICTILWVNVRYCAYFIVEESIHTKSTNCVIIRNYMEGNIPYGKHISAFLFQMAVCMLHALYYLH